MQLSELKFKVITITEERNIAIQEALFKKGATWCGGDTKIRHTCAFSLAYNASWLDGEFKNNLTFSSDMPNFNDIKTPEVTYQQALDLINGVTPEVVNAWKECIYDIDKHGIFIMDGNLRYFNEQLFNIRGKLVVFGGYKYTEDGNWNDNLEGLDKDSKRTYFYDMWEKPLIPKQVRYFVKMD